MTKTACWTALAAALALAACSREPDAPEPVPTEVASSEPQVATPAVDDTPATPVPADTPAPAATPSPAATEIPKAIRGRWGLVPADCTSKLGDAKGLLTISARQLKFYESVAKIGTVKEAAETRIRATFGYSGEGQSWTQDVVLEVQGGGGTLVRRDYGKDAMPGPFKYTRCT